MNIVIVGLGKVGCQLVERLSDETNYNITVIDTRDNVLKNCVNTYDVIGVEGSGTSLDVLREARVKNADVVIAVTGSDEMNLLTCLMAKKLGASSTIARVRNPKYSKEMHLLKEDFGISMVINPELTAAGEIARLLRFPSAVEVDTFAKGRAEILRFKIVDGSPLDGIFIKDIHSTLNCDILVCGVERGDEAFIPNGNFEIHAGDFISIVGSIKNASSFIKKIGLKTNRAKDTMIVGGGKIAVYLANNLMKSGMDVKVVEQDTARCEELCEIIPKATIINGDGTDNRLLLEEGIENAGSFVALTGIDEENVLLSLYAKTKTAGRVITKINKIDYGEVIDNIGLDTVVYPKDIVAEYIVRFVRGKNNSLGSNIETMHYILDDKAEALEFAVGENSPVTDKTLESLELKPGVLVACINRGGDIITPRGKDIIKGGDTVIIVTTNGGFKDISDILR